MKSLHSLIAITLLAAFAHPVMAADDDLAARIAACTRERDDAQRLACFDRAAEPKQALGDKISATVTAIDKRPRGELVFTLDNGQVWAQKDVGAYFPVKVGDAVSILAGALGSFRLVVANRATAVTRVQ
jgi:hypothetical protein